MSPTPTPKRGRSSREPWKAPRDRRELVKAIGAGAAVVVLSIGAVLFLGRDHLGSDESTPTTPVQTSPAGSVTTPTTPVTPDSTPPASAPAGETLTPTPSATDTSTSVPGAPTP
jgi:hypothetical protein